MSAAQLFENLKLRILADPESFRNRGDRFKFVVEGSSGGIWVLDLGANPCLSKGDLDSECTLNISVEDLVSIASGSLNPQLAFLQGKLRLTGDVSQALVLEPILSGALAG